jgi:hypothetical protein
MITKLAETIGKAHGKFFSYLSSKAQTSKLFALLLTIVALYEIFEHIFVPIVAALWASGNITVN